MKKKILLFCTLFFAFSFASQAQQKDSITLKNSGFWIFRVPTYTINGKVEGRKWKVKESFKTNPEAYQIFKKARKNELISTGLTTLVLGELCYDLFSKNKEYKGSKLATGVSVVSLLV